MIFRFWNSLSTNARIVWGVTIGLGLWLASGLVFPHQPEPEQARPANTTTEVEVSPLSPEPYTRMVVVSGATEAEEKAVVAARTSGIVTRLSVNRGHEVSTGQVLAVLDMGKRPIDKAAARAELDRARRLVESARALAKDGYVADTVLAEREASFAAARQALAAIDQDIGYTRIAAPMDGVVEDTAVTVGDYVSIGTPVATLVRRDNILVVGDVAQTERDLLQPGVTVSATLAGGMEVPAQLRFIATDANPQTRTFRVEAVVDGTRYPVPTGMSARLTIPVSTEQAYRIPHAWLVLGAAGEVGVMLADQPEIKGNQAQATVRWQQVDIVEDTSASTWVKGLPQSATPLRIVSRGQAALVDGASITWVTQPEKASPQQQQSNESQPQ